MKVIIALIALVAVANAAECNFETYDFNAAMAAAAKCQSVAENYQNSLVSACTDFTSNKCATVICEMIVATFKCAIDSTPCWNQEMRTEVNELIKTLSTSTDCDFPENTYTYDIVYPSLPTDFGSLAEDQKKDVCKEILTNMGYSDVEARCNVTDAVTYSKNRAGALVLSVKIIDSIPPPLDKLSSQISIPYTTSSGASKSYASTASPSVGVQSSAFGVTGSLILAAALIFARIFAF